MVKYKTNCTICQASKLDAKLRARIRHAAFKREEGDETLSDIALEKHLTIGSMYNHARKHIQDVSELYVGNKEIKVAKATAKFRVEAQKELETVIAGDVMDTIEARPQEIIALDNYIAQAKELIDKKELKINASTFLTAVKVRNDWAKGQATNKLDFLKTIYAYASSDKKEIEDAKYSTEQDGQGDNRGEEEPKDIYGTITGAEPS